ncbi:MAG: ribosome maturation factor RimM [Coriobacteriia bacterium]|nr:ribosome maturation factor RimM [Coriobacteriia bacterium]
MDSAFLPLGRVARTHGLNGEVSVVLTADLPVERLVGLEVWFAPPPALVRSARITAIRPGPKGPLFAFDGVADIGTASTLRGCNVLVRAGELPEVEEEFDPVGLTVIDEERGVIGEIADVIVTGANDVWIVEGGPFGQVLIPVIDDVVLEFDEDADAVHVRLLPGLIEE